MPKPGQTIKTKKPQVDKKILFFGLLNTMNIQLPVCEHVFDTETERKWRFDYAWPGKKIALEQEGGIWKKGGGGHSHPIGIKRDIEKYNKAAQLGWRIFRTAPEDLLSPETIKLLKSVL